eukprot:CAMPEP_0172724852 /NCGR_PEP_ID=MMETSP1074-20121228/86999_1 /TAXON_ID=2916 /ORGANISM="Ceratium fusus, Strain PA161109" /LENGTH=236 /DNA_ID=CAMNT_0013551455 /DNA_START=72 /DNA_END=785 /DNA_ORIENTATION=+
MSDLPFQKGELVSYSDGKNIHHGEIWSIDEVELKVKGGGIFAIPREKWCAVSKEQGADDTHHDQSCEMVPKNTLLVDLTRVDLRDAFRACPSTDVVTHLGQAFGCCGNIASISVTLGTKKKDEVTISFADAEAYEKAMQSQEENYEQFKAMVAKVVDEGATQRAEKLEAEIVAATGATTYALAELQEGCPSGVPPTMKENFLSDADFELAFKMSRADFLKLPQWKRDIAKKDAKLF